MKGLPRVAIAMYFDIHAFSSDWARSTISVRDADTHNNAAARRLQVPGI
jgi:hypothetical protein